MLEKLEAIIASLAAVQDEKGLTWLEGYVDAEATTPGGFRDVNPDRVEALLATIAVDSQQVAALGHLTDTEIIIDNGNHRRAACIKLRIRLKVRLLRKEDATPERIRAMRGTVEESATKLDDWAILRLIHDTIRDEGLSAVKAAEKHHTRREVWARCGYVFELPEDDAYRQLVMARRLKMDAIAILKRVKPEDRLTYAQRLAAGTLTTKGLKDELAATANASSTANNGNGKTAPKPLTYRRKQNGTEIIATYQDRLILAAELRKAADELDSEKRK